MQDPAPIQTIKRKRARRRITGLACALIVLLGVVGGLWSAWSSRQRKIQIQTDSRVATVWVAGITFGPQQQLTRGTEMQKWFNARNMHSFGDYTSLKSQYGGDPGGVEIWFDYASYLPGHAYLECHRVGTTAFTDDLGQVYHGYLDMQGKMIGVYLPGYDHAARRLRCTLHWMPRKPARPEPVSIPMVFNIDLPALPRLLPLASTLPRRDVSVTSKGVTVTVAEARLSGPLLADANSAQRNLTFRVKVEGGQIANANLSDPSYESNLFPPDVLEPQKSSMSKTPRTARRGADLPVLSEDDEVPVTRISALLTLTDPYGISLIAQNQKLVPLKTKDAQATRKAGNGTVWVAPVNGAGRSTDVVRLHFDVRPMPQFVPHTGTVRPAIPFDITIPVQTGDDI